MLCIMFIRHFNHLVRKSKKRIVNPLLKGEYSKVWRNLWKELNSLTELTKTQIETLRNLLKEMIIMNQNTGKVFTAFIGRGKGLNQGVDSNVDIDSTATILTPQALGFWTLVSNYIPVRSIQTVDPQMLTNIARFCFDANAILESVADEYYQTVSQGSQSHTASRTRAVG